MDQFISTWQRFHQNTAPIDYILKFDKTDLWLRFHSLPESKRYANTDEEMSIILHRQNTVAGEVLGDGTLCWMIGHLYAGDGTESGDDAWRQETKQYFQRCNMTKVQRVPNPDDPELAYDIFAIRVVWQQGTFDALLRAIANDELRIMWMSEQTGAIFAPYDGGMDIILPNTEEIQALARSHSDWLSSYPGGY